MIPPSPCTLHQMLSLSDLSFFIMQIYCLYILLFCSLFFQRRSLPPTNSLVSSLLFFLNSLSLFLDSYVLKLEKADVYRLPYLSSGAPGFGLYFPLAFEYLDT